MNLAKSSIKIFAARLLGSITNFVAIILFSRELGASVLGSYYPFLALLGIFAIPADLGVRSATEKRISEGDDVSSYLTTAILLKLPPLTIIALVCWFFRDYINIYLGSELALLLILALISGEISRFSVTVLRGEMRVGETAIIEAIRPVCWLFIGYAFHEQAGVYALVLGYLVGSVLMGVFGWTKVSISISFPSVEKARSLFEYGRYSVISSIGGYFYSWMDVAMLSAFVSLGIAGTRSGIGAYENAWRLTLLVMLLSESIATTLFPQFSRWDALDAADEIENLIPKAILPSIVLVIPAFFATIVLSKDILEILFGSEFTIAWLALIILSGEKILQSVHVVLGRSLQAIDRPDLAAYATIISAFTNLLLNVILIWHFGIVGAAVATTVSFGVNTFLHANYLSRFLSVQFPLRESAWATVCSLIMSLFVYLLNNQFSVETIGELLGIVIIGVLVYFSLLFLYAPVRTMAQGHLKILYEQF